MMSKPNLDTISPDESEPLDSSAPPTKDTPQALKIAVIEDDPTVRRMLEALLNATEGMGCCGAWSTGEDALVELPEMSPDVVLVDLGLPGMSGMECIKELSGRLPCAAFVVLSSHEDKQWVFAALRAGANGYLLKSGSPEDLIAGVRAAHRGGSPLSPEIAGHMIRNFQQTPPKQPGKPLPALTPREKELLEHLAKGMVPKEAAAEMGISYETARDYLKRIYQKMGVRSRTEAVLRFVQASAGEEDTPN